MSEQMTITEALADIKTIGKRLEKKRQFVSDYLYRQEKLRDPLEKEGGSKEAIAAAMQSIADLENRVVRIRGAISKANAEATLTIGKDTRTVQDWLVYRREIATGQQSFIELLRRRIQQVRQEAQQKGIRVTEGGAQDLNDVIVNYSESKLADTAEHIETVLGELDGKLSLLNATTTVTV